jgi:AraC-like DNA-binding protein
MKIAYEKIVLEAGSSFAILDKRAAKFDGRFHFHPEFEITLIESSLGRRIVGDSIESFSPGDLVLLGENLPHQYVSDSATPGPPAMAKVIQFGKDFLGEGFLAAPESADILGLLKRSRCGLRFGSDSAGATRLIEGIFAASGFERLMLLLGLLRALSADDQARPIASPGYIARISSREGDTIDKALRYLNERFSHPISFTDLCRHLHVTSATCNRLFRKSVGRSFKSVLIEIRISHACRLLLETDQSIVDIAYASGFANLSNFNRRFRKIKARSPRDYRNLSRR